MSDSGRFEALLSHQGPLVHVDHSFRAPAPPVATGVRLESGSAAFQVWKIDIKATFWYDATTTFTVQNGSIGSLDKLQSAVKSALLDPNVRKGRFRYAYVWDMQDGRKVLIAERKDYPKVVHTNEDALKRALLEAVQRHKGAETAVDRVSIHLDTSEDPPTEEEKHPPRPQPPRRQFVEEGPRKAPVLSEAEEEWLEKMEGTAAETLGSETDGATVEDLKRALGSLNKVNFKVEGSDYTIRFKKEWGTEYIVIIENNKVWKRWTRTFSYGTRIIVNTPFPMEVEKDRTRMGKVLHEFFAAAKAQRSGK